MRLGRKLVEGVAGLLGYDRQEELDKYYTAEIVPEMNKNIQAIIHPTEGTGSFDDAQLEVLKSRARLSQHAGDPNIFDKIHDPFRETQAYLHYEQKKRNYWADSLKDNPQYEKVLGSQLGDKTPILAHNGLFYVKRPSIATQLGDIYGYESAGGLGVKELQGTPETNVTGLPTGLDPFTDTSTAGTGLLPGRGGEEYGQELLKKITPQQAYNLGLQAAQGPEQQQRFIVNAANMLKGGDEKRTMMEQTEINILKNQYSTASNRYNKLTNDINVLGFDLETIDEAAIVAKYGDWLPGQKRRRNDDTPKLFNQPWKDIEHLFKTTKGLKDNAEQRLREAAGGQLTGAPRGAPSAQTWGQQPVPTAVDPFASMWKDPIEEEIDPPSAKRYGTIGDLVQLMKKPKTGLTPPTGPPFPLQQTVEAQVGDKEPDITAIEGNIKRIKASLGTLETGGVLSGMEERAHARLTEEITNLETQLEKAKREPRKAKLQQPTPYVLDLVDRVKLMLGVIGEQEYMREKPQRGDPDPISEIMRKYEEARKVQLSMPGETDETIYRAIEAQAADQGGATAVPSQILQDARSPAAKMPTPESQPPVKLPKPPAQVTPDQEEYEKFAAGLSEDVITENMTATGQTRERILKALFKFYLDHPDDARFSFMKK